MTKSHFAALFIALTMSSMAFLGFFCTFQVQMHSPARGRTYGSCVVVVVVVVEALVVDVGGSGSLAVAVLDSTGTVVARTPSIVHQSRGGRELVRPSSTGYARGPEIGFLARNGAGNAACRPKPNCERRHSGEHPNS